MNLRKVLRDFLFMLTVRDRFLELGLTLSVKSLSFAGERVSQTFREENPEIKPLRTEQTEGEYTFFVNVYPRYWQERMDYVIILACAELYKKDNANG